jgi:hypothetical protein
MRVLTTAVAATLTMGLLGLATPAFADSNSGHGNRNGGGAYGQGQPTQSQPPQGQPPQGQPYGGAPGYQGGQGNNDDDYYDDRDDDRGHGRGSRGHDRRDDDRAYDRNERDFQGWEQSWRRPGDGWGHHGHDRTLTYRQIVRRIERQGYYDVRRLQPSRHGFGWRAFARFRLDGRIAMLRIDPYSGRVIAARRV